MSDQWIDKFIEDSKGHITLWQRPNLPLAVWLGATLLARVIQQGSAHDIVALISFGAIFTWSWLEIFSGVNYFRRALGLVIMAFAISSRIVGN